MPKTIVTVRGVRVTSELIGDLVELLRPFSLRAAKELLSVAPGVLPEQKRSVIESGGRAYFSLSEVVRDGVTFNADEEPPDFDYAADHDSLRGVVMGEFVGGQLQLTSNDFETSVVITAPAEFIESLSDGVQKRLAASVDPERLEIYRRPFKIFVGHGGDSRWQILQLSLRERGYRVEAFESEERAGYPTLAVVEQMIRSSTVAVVVMTGEDQMPDGSMRARENVVHELGMCQGILGIDRTIILLEVGTSEPSNIEGLTQIRFPRDGLSNVMARIIEALEQRREADEYTAA